MNNRYIIFFFSFIFLGSLDLHSQKWQKNLDSLTSDSSKLILLNFTGSDWCSVCKKLKNHLFENKLFVEYSDRIQLVQIDFPIDKENFSKEELNYNAKLLEQYNKKAIFPYTILLDNHKNILKIWSGYISTPADKFIDELKLVHESIGK